MLPAHACGPARPGGGRIRGGAHAASGSRPRRAMKAARWILSRFAPPEWRESMEGDLCEEQARRRTVGRYAGWAWSVPAAIGLVRALRSTNRTGVVSGRRARLMSG